MIMSILPTRYKGNIQVTLGELEILSLIKTKLPLSRFRSQIRSPQHMACRHIKYARNTTLHAGGFLREEPQNGKKRREERKVRKPLVARDS